KVSTSPSEYSPYLSSILPWNWSFTLYSIMPCRHCRWRRWALPQTSSPGAAIFSADTSSAICLHLGLVPGRRVLGLLDERVAVHARPRVLGLQRQHPVIALDRLGEAAEMLQDEAAVVVGAVIVGLGGDRLVVARQRFLVAAHRDQRVAAIVVQLGHARP